MQPGQNPTSGEPPPHPQSVDGVQVLSASWVQPPLGRETDPVFAGRTMLKLANGHRRNGCADCDFTHIQWSSVVKHRADAHGAPSLGRSLRMKYTQQEIATTPAENPVLPATPAQEDVQPAPSKAAHTAAAHDTGPMAMTIGEVVELAMHLHAAGDALERMTADRNDWKAQALAAKRDLQKVQRILGKATDVVSKKDGDTQL